MGALKVTRFAIGVVGGALALWLVHEWSVWPGVIAGAVGGGYVAANYASIWETIRNFRPSVGGL